TPLPYTTLFRSLGLRVGECAGDHVFGRAPGLVEPPRRHVGSDQDVFHHAAFRAAPRGGADRKVAQLAATRADADVVVGDAALSRRLQQALDLGVGLVAAQRAPDVAALQ